MTGGTSSLILSRLKAVSKGEAFLCGSHDCARLSLPGLTELSIGRPWTGELVQL